MTIQFLNSDYTEAIVTRGVLRKRYALVKRGEIRPDGWYLRKPWWVFSSTNRALSWWVNFRIEMLRASERRQHDRRVALLKAEREWLPVPAEFPKARLLGRRV